MLSRIVVSAVFLGALTLAAAACTNNGQSTLARTTVPTPTAISTAATDLTSSPRSSPASTPTPTPAPTPSSMSSSSTDPTPPPCGLAVPDQSENPGLTRDCINLLPAMDTLRGTATLNWSVDTPISDWEGIWVQGSPGRVTGLILSSKNLSGTIPPDLARLDALEHLRLNDNMLTGEIPAALGNLGNLRSLMLNDNMLTGEVPAALVSLVNLWQLQLASNQLDCIPRALRKVWTNDPYDLRLPVCDLPDDGQRVEVIDRSGDDECLDRYDIRYVGGNSVLISPAPETGSGVLEQRALENDVIVLGKVLGVETKVVSVDSVKSKLSRPSIYEGFERTLVIEVHLRVDEYLKGGGPDEITALIEGQSVFNTEEEGACAKTAYPHGYGRLVESQQGIALMTYTGDPGVYHLGYADENIDGRWLVHSTWLAGDEGRFYDATREEWIGIDEARVRVSSVVEEYDRRDDERWRNCVSYKYYHRGRDPWAYRGTSWPYEYYRDHDINFNGERAPVRAGETVWSHADYEGYLSEFRLWLGGRDADLFEVSYHSEFEKIANEWSAASGGIGHRLAIWYVHPQPSVEQWRQTVSGYVIKAVEDLAGGEYQFYLHAENQREDYVECGQGFPEPNRFRVIVGADRATVPAAPSNVMVIDDLEGWTIVWDPADGVDDYWVYVYRRDGSGEKDRVYVGEDTEEPGYRIRFDELDGCDDLVYVEIYPEGDGETYLKDFGERSEVIELRTGPCEN